VSEADLRVLSARAKRVHRGNLSAVVHELVLALKRQEAADQLLEMLGGDSVTEREMQAMREEISSAGRRRKRGNAA
jgi:hypothetical protein